MPVKSVAVWEGGVWKGLVATIDNYFEYHGDSGKVWAPCAKVQITSILGDTVEDSVCCSSGAHARPAACARQCHASRVSP